MKRYIAIMLSLLLVIPFLMVNISAASDDPYDLLAFGYTFDNENLDEVLGKNQVVYYDDYDITSGKYTDGKIGKALQFGEDGATDPTWLEIPFDTLNTDAFSISFWYKATSYNEQGNDSELFSFVNTKVEKFLYYSPMKTTGEWTYIMKWGGNTDRLHYYDVWVSGTETPKPIGDWTHVVFTWVSDDTQGTSSVKVYLNGTLCPQEGADAWTDTFYSLGINRLSFGGSNPYRAGGEGCIFHGALDNLYFFNDELDEDQVKFLYNQTESYATLPQETTTEAPDTSVTDTTKEEEDTSVADTSEETTPDAESSAANTTDNAADTTDNTAEKESPSVLPIVIAVIAVIVVAAVVIVLVKRKKS